MRTERGFALIVVLLVMAIVGVIGDSLQDWRDANEEHRLNGAESDDFYLKLPLPYRAHNANLESITELLQIHGVLETPAIFWGTEERPGLADVVTVKSPGNQINMNTATTCAMQALGLSDAEIGEIMQSRSLAPYWTLPGKFGAKGLSVTTQTFRVEAQGIVSGRVDARLIAIVRRPSNATPPTIQILEWSAPR